MTTKTIRTWISYRCKIHQLALIRPMSADLKHEYDGRLDELKALAEFCNCVDSTALPSAKEWADSGFDVPESLCGGAK